VRRSDWLLSQLPMGMLDDDFFVRFVSLFEEVATSYLEGADNIPNVVDVDVAPPELVRWLGSWIGMPPLDSSLAEDLQRRLVSTASAILAWRGTRQGLEQFLAVVTGGQVEVEENGGIGREGTLGDRPPFVRMRVDSIGWLSDADFVALVRDEVPANVTYELFVGDRRLWPATEAEPAA